MGAHDKVGKCLETELREALDEALGNLDDLASELARVRVRLDERLKRLSKEG